jgi:hypothetical protein
MVNVLIENLKRLCLSVILLHTKDLKIVELSALAGALVKFRIVGLCKH